MQRKKDEWRNTGFDEPEMKKNNNGNDGEEGEKRDLYAEYDVDPPSEGSEKREGDAQENEDDEDVSQFLCHISHSIHAFTQYGFISSHIWSTSTSTQFVMHVLVFISFCKYVCCSFRTSSRFFT